MTEIHKHRDTHEHILEESTIFGLHFFLPREETSESRHFHGFFFFFFSFFCSDQLANVLQNDWKERLKIKKQIFGFVCYRRLFGLEQVLACILGLTSKWNAK